MSEPQQFEFTDRELELIGMEIADKKSTDAAQCLGISYRTLTTHWSRIHSRTGLGNRGAVVAHILNSELRYKMELLMEAHKEK